MRVFKDPTGALWVDNIPKPKNNYTEHEICKTKDSFIFSFKDNVCYCVTRVIRVKLFMSLAIIFFQC